MTNSHRILVVARSPGVLHNVFGWLAAAGLEAQLQTDFASARPALETRPDLLITEVKLGPHNGLHLAMHARWNQPPTPTIVIGERSDLLAEEASRQHATYLAEPLTQDTFAATTRGILGE